MAKRLNLQVESDDNVIKQKNQVPCPDFLTKEKLCIYMKRGLTIDDDAKLLASLHSSGYKAKPERALVFTVEAWDVNCPQHIQQRFTMEELQPEFDKLNNRIKELEDELSQVIKE